MPNILQIKNLTKLFPGVRALNNVNLSVKEGEIHALVGENGAGKSTLMKVLCGLYAFGNYEGEILIDGVDQRFEGIRDSEKKGIAIIFQELMLFRELSIAENIYIGGGLGKNGFVNWNLVNKKSKELLNHVKLSESPETLVKDLGVGKQQMVEIMKALAKEARILILDEPTAALTDKEAEHLLDIIKNLNKKGVTCIYISHRIKEVLQISNSVTILRDGQTVGTFPTSELDENKIVSMMVGRNMSDRYPKATHEIGEVVFEVKKWSIKNYEKPHKNIVDDISFDLRRGEILGIAGLMGSGRTELVSSLFGIDLGITSGEIYFNNSKIQIKSPSDAIWNGICLLTEDRKKLGLNFEGTIEMNMAIQNLKLFSRFGVINDNKEVVLCKKYADELNIKSSSLQALVGKLSGGNQQKVILAKLLMSHPKILILDEPTRGIDVGAKFEIYTLMNKLREEGMSIIMISSELPEVLGMSDRVMVMKEGKATGIFINKNLTEEIILKSALEV